MTPRPALPPTWTVGLGFVREELLGPQRSAGLQLGLGELRQVRHDGVLIHVGVHDLLGGDDLEESGGLIFNRRVDF